MLGWAATFLTDRRTWLLLAVLAAFALIAARPLARRAGWSLWPTLGMLLGIAAVALLTLSPAPDAAVDAPLLDAAGDCVRVLADPAGWARALVSLENRGERVGNLAMFVPACFFAVLASRRPVVVAVIGVAAPVTIEFGQAVLAAGRNCAADDWVNNASGALLGVAAGVVALAVGRLVRPGAADHGVEGAQHDHDVERQ